MLEQTLLNSKPISLLQRALQAIDQNYDSVEAYLQDALGVGPAELAELRGRYLA